MPERDPVLPTAVAPHPRPNLGLIGAFLAAAFIFGLLLPGLALHPFNCTTPAAAALARQNAAIAQNSQLTTQLAQLDEQAAQQRAQCTSPPKPALPQNAWNSGKLDMLSGCWQLVTHINMRQLDTGAQMSVASWRICFDKKGNGIQTVSYDSGDSCTGPVDASFNSGHEMTIHEPSVCSGNSYPVLGHWLCKRVSDSQADCTRTDNYGQTEGIFQR